jgi:eukaryotic-like serine/threonine-protein kinase
VSVLIADFQNGTGDPAFDRTLEPMLRLALEGAGFISAYDRSGVRSALGVRPPEQLDERAAMELAVKQGVGVVLAGSVDRQGDRYTVMVKATQAVTGHVIASATQRASSKDQVLAAATRLASTVREALGDDTTGSAQRFAMETLSATSLEAVREYARGMDALSRARFDEALQRFTRAVEIDPKFGSAYGAKSIAARNLERMQDARLHIEEALRHLDTMTERERYRTRGMYYLQTNDHQACVKEYGELIARFSADAAARNNRALCLTYLRDLPAAVEEMRQAVKILPNRALYRENLALYAAYSGDFAGAEQEVEQMAEPGAFGLLARAFAQIGQGQVPAAIATYEALGALDEQGASYMASGLADIAIYEGRYGDAVRILRAGAASDIASEASDRAASKLVALARAELLREQRPAAIAAAEKALDASQSVGIQFLAARVFAQAGATARAQALAGELSAQFQAEPQAYGKIIEGLIALEAGNSRQAVQVLTQANGLLDTWIGHFELGRAYLEAGALPQADSEFDRCLKRRGEALSLFLDEMPTYGYFPPVYYYQGRVREGLKSVSFADSYLAYMGIRGQSTEDRLLPDARRRAAGN